MSSNDKKIHGALAQLTAKHVCDGASHVKHGKVYSLAIITSPESYSYAGRFYQVLTDRIYVGDQNVFGDNKLQGIDDYVCMWCGVGTHIDGFGHVATRGKHFDGLPTEQVIHARGAAEYGVETIPPIATRGVLLDIPRLKGVEALPESYEITCDDIDQACRLQGVEIQPGDVVITHTGQLQDIENKRPYSASGHGSLDPEAGIGLSAARYLIEEKGAVVLGADNYSLEVLPATEPGIFLPVHEYLLVTKGVHILENVWTKDLARDQVYEFFFVVAAPKLQGAVQAPIHPIALC